MALLERLVWAVLAGAAIWLVGTGMVDTFYIEGTDEALATAKTGIRHIYEGSSALVLLAAYAGLRGARRWALGLVLIPAVAWAVLAAVAGETLFPQLAFLAAAPFAAAGVLAVLVLNPPARSPGE